MTPAQYRVAATWVPEKLIAGRTAGRYQYLGAPAGRDGYAIELDNPVGTVRRDLDLQGAVAWLDGFDIGVDRAGDGTGGDGAESGPWTGRRRVFREVGEFLGGVDSDDARRVRIWWAMEQDNLTLQDIAVRMNADRHTARSLLTFGRQPARRTKMSRSLAEVEEALQLLRPQAKPEAAAAVKPEAAVEGDPVVPWVGPLAGRQEPGFVQWYRGLAMAFEAVVIEGWDPIDPNEFRHAGRVTVDVTRSVMRDVVMADVLPWLQGIADGAEWQLRQSGEDSTRMGRLAHNLTL